MRRLLTVALVLSLLMVGVAACKASAPAPKPLVNPEVKLTGVFVAYPGPALDTKTPPDAGKLPPADATKVAMMFDAVLSVSNPNAYDITVDSINLSLVADGEQITFKGTEDDITVPSLGTTKVTLSFPLAFSTPFGFQLVQKGKTPADALAIVIPWWMNLRDGRGAWNVTGEARVTSTGGNAGIPLNFTWP